MCPYVYLFDFNGTAGQATSITITHVDTFFVSFFVSVLMVFACSESWHQFFLFCLPFYRSALVQETYRIIDDNEHWTMIKVRVSCFIDLIDLYQI